MAINMVKKRRFSGCNRISTVLNVWLILTWPVLSTFFLVLTPKDSYGFRDFKSKFLKLILVHRLTRKSFIFLPIPLPVPIRIQEVGKHAIEKQHSSYIHPPMTEFPWPHHNQWAFGSEEYGIHKNVFW